MGNNVGAFIKISRGGFLLLMLHRYANDGYGAMS